MSTTKDNHMLFIKRLPLLLSKSQARSSAVVFQVGKPPFGHIVT